MKTPTTTSDFLTGSAFADEIIGILSAQLPEFRHTRQQYHDALAKLNGDHPCDLDAAVDQLAACILQFCGLLGAKANWEHFLNPVSKCFLDADAEIYLRRAAFPSLPDCQAAQMALDQFSAAATPEQQLLYEKVTDYLCYLETAGPYLAHYLGYQYAGQLYSRIIPGYYQDPGLTLRYQRMLNNYFGTPLFP